MAHGGQLKLTAAERAFFKTVRAAVVANPFSAERLELDAAIVGLAPTVAAADVIEAVIRRVNAHADQMERAGRADFRRFAAGDGEAVRYFLLFDVFHRFIAAFDDLIRRQMAAGDEPCAVPFARDALGLLTGRGFSTDEAERSLAVFYQLRRAFFFINRQLVGRGPGMRELRMRLWTNLFTHDLLIYADRLWDRMEDFSTLLLGETGTGKGAAAAALGRSGFIPFAAKKGCFAESFCRNFIAINLSQFPENLIESELFGHCKGAFTGAVEHHEGIFSRCSPHGAIFLDEIGDVALPVQLKLLKVLQERTFSPVGSHEVRRFRGRVIAATNRDLGGLLGSGKFRADFYYRLCSDVITVPPLRQRLQEDAGELTDMLGVAIAHIVGQAAPDLQGRVAACLNESPGPEYGWPGNVRELEQAVRRILVAGRYEPATVTAGTAVGPASWFREDGLLAQPPAASGLLAAYCALLYRRHGNYGAVARISGLDRRTVRKYVGLAEDGTGTR